MNNFNNPKEKCQISFRIAAVAKSIEITKTTFEAKRTVKTIKPFIPLICSCHSNNCVIEHDKKKICSFLMEFK